MRPCAASGPVRQQRAGQVAGDHDHVVLARPGQARAVAQAAVGVAVHQRADPGVGAQVQQRADDRVVQQVLAHRPVGPHGDAEPVQQRRRADAGALQDRRRVDRPGAQDHLARARGVWTSAADAHPHARWRAGGCPPSQRLDQRAADDRQVGAAAGRLQVAVVGGHAPPVDAVDRVGRRAGPVGRVVVLAPAVAQAQRGLAQRAVHAAPGLERRAVDRDRPASPW